MEDINSTNYLRALKSKPLKEITLKIPERRKAILTQKNKCYKCKRPMHPFYHKYIKDPATNELRVFCSDCAIQSTKKN